VFSWLSRVLRSSRQDPPLRQLQVIEEAEPQIELTLEERLQRLANRSGAYTQRDDNELREIIADLDAVLDIVDSIISVVENVNATEDAKRLRSRLRGRRTRAQNALSRRTA